MPRLPDIQDLGKRPIPRPEASIARGVQPDIKMLLRPGQEFESAGRQISGIGEGLQREVEREKARIDTARAEDAFTELRNRQIELSDGEEQGFRRQRGADAIKQPLLKSWTARFDDASKAISDKLDNDEQRALFSSRANVSKLQFSHDIMQHLGRENDVYQEQVFDSGLSIELQEAAARWREPGSVFASMERMEALIDERADLRGWSPEKIKDAKLKASSNVHTAVISNALANEDYTYASNWYEQNKDEISPQVAARVKTDVANAEQKQLATQYKFQFLDSRDSRGALSGLQKAVRNDGKLDDDRKIALLSSIDQRITTLDNQARIAAEKASREADKEWTAAVSLIESGKSFSPEYSMRLQQKLKGTPYADALNELLNDAPANHAFSAQPVHAREAALTEMLEKGNDPARGWTPAEQKRYEKLRTAHDKTMADIKENPFVAGLERGVLPDIAPLQVDRLSTLLEQLPARVQQADDLRTWTRKDQSPLQPQEAQQVATLIQNMPADQRAAALGELAGRMSPGQMRALSSQLGGKNNSLAIAGFLAANRTSTTKGRSVAELYLAGDETIKQGRADIDNKKETGVRSTIYSELQGAYASQSGLESAADVAYKVYAQMKSEGDDDVERAIRIATGGIMERNGKKFPKPYGWSDDEVDDALNSFTQEDIAAISGGNVVLGNAAMTPQQFVSNLPSARLRPSPIPDTYLLEFGPHVALTANGKPLLLPLRGKRKP